MLQCYDLYRNKYNIIVRNAIEGGDPRKTSLLRDKLSEMKRDRCKYADNFCKIFIKSWKAYVLKSRRI